ncbi:MAG: DUF3800 domain-containing protein [Bacilli bacterium]|nr:DUF3800 domain-containing protein [Bacilli bacterium]
MKQQEQVIYINLDDSGKLSNKERVSTYGGLIFLSKAEKDKFITQYRLIINEIKCKYCSHRNNCNYNCPEIKNTNILPKDKRHIMNYLKKYYCLALVIQNEHVYNHIKENKAAKGRFTDYCLRRLIKELIQSLIKNKQISPYVPLKLVINIDEQSTKSDGYYNLHAGLIEELKYGIVNYNYSSTIAPIIHADLKITVTYQDSGKSYVVQAADFLAGTIRRASLKALEEKKVIPSSLGNITNFLIILP